MKLEVGKFYRDRSGGVHGPMQSLNQGIYRFASGDTSWTRDGYCVHGITNSLDLVEEAPDPRAAEPATADEGRKNDAEKDPWHLLPTDAIRGIVRVLGFGAAKYAPRNWEKGMAWSRPYGALQRHMTAWWEGEAKDPETGFSHLWHAGCCVLFLIAYEMRGSGTDDRPR